MKGKLFAWVRGMFIALTLLFVCLVLMGQECPVPGITEPVFPGSEQEAFERTNKDTRMPHGDTQELQQTLGDNFLRIQLWLKEDDAVLISLPHLYDADGNEIQYDLKRVRCYLYNDTYGLTALFARAKETIDAAKTLLTAFETVTGAWKLWDANNNAIKEGYSGGIVQSAEIEGASVRKISDLALGSLGGVTTLKDPSKAAECVAAAGMGLADVQQFAMQKLLGSERSLIMGYGDVLTIDFHEQAFPNNILPQKVTFNYAYLDFEKLKNIKGRTLWSGDYKTLGSLTETNSPYMGNVNWQFMGLNTQKTRMLFLLHTNQDIWWPFDSGKPKIEGAIFNDKLSLSVSPGSVVQKTLR